MAALSIPSRPSERHDDAAATALPRERPPIRNVEDFWCWLNTWGNLHKHEPKARPDRISTAWREGYQKAIGDAMKALEDAGVGFDQVRDGAWDRWTGR